MIHSALSHDAISCYICCCCLEAGVYVGSIQLLADWTAVSCGRQLRVMRSIQHAVPSMRYLCPCNIISWHESSVAPCARSGWFRYVVS